MREGSTALRLTLASAAALVLVGGTAAASGTASGDDSRSHGKHGGSDDSKHSGSPGWGHPGHGHHHRGGVERVALRGVDGARIGWATLREKHGHVQVDVMAQGLTPGFHGFHVHGTGLCEADAPDGPFTTAGGHYAGDSPEHGDHSGDLPPLLVIDDGRAWSSFVTDRFTLDELRDDDGSAVMVHSGRDNFANIPDRYTSGGVPGPDATTLATGDAGTRVACGVID